MRADSEKKTRTITLRVTEEQYQSIKDKADRNHMTVSSYVLDKTVHSQNAMTPEIMVRIQSLLNMAYQYTSPLVRAEFEREENQLWSILR